MQIIFPRINYKYGGKTNKWQNHSQSSTVLKEDTVSFSAMKKNQFEGIAYAIVERFKAPIEKFKSLNDFQNWAKNQAQAIAEKDYGGRYKETRAQRKTLLKEWADYVLNENTAYIGGISLLVLSAVTKNLKPDNDKIPPVLNKGVLADCIAEIDKNTRQNPKEGFDFNKIYQTKLNSSYLEETRHGEADTKWVVIPSKEHDPHNFDANVKKLQALSHKNWCTKSYNAEPYLMQGDFHIYLENGQPKLGVRFVWNVIQEIQGENNDSKIPVNYLGIVEKHVNENRFRTGEKADAEIAEAKKVKEKIDGIRKDLKSVIEENDVKSILEYFYVEVEQDKDGLLTISGYQQPLSGCTFADLGINENRLFEKIKVINDKANFVHSKVTNLGALKAIYGSADFSYSSLGSLGKLEIIGKNAEFYHSPVANLGNLKSIGGDAAFYRSNVTDLGELQTIGGNVTFELSQIQKLGKLKYIGGNANFTRSAVTDLGDLETIGGDADFKHSQMTSLNNLAVIGGAADFRLCDISSLGKLRSIGKNAGFGRSVECIGLLEKIGGDAVFSNSKITNLKNLEYIGGDANFADSQILNLGNLKIIGGDANFKNTKFVTLGNLETIGKDADFSDSEITSLGSLKSIGGDGNFINSLFQSLNKLETIGGYANFGASQILDTGNLKSIGGGANFRDTKITALGSLETINGNTDFSNSQVNNLGNLITIEGDAIFTGSLITNLGVLQRIGGNAYMSNSQIVNLGDLKTIVEDAYISKSPLKNEDFKNVDIGGILQNRSNLSSRWRRFLGEE